ncbi:tigger transposable element-derived protein 4 [Aplysia californica]|uniref:Tigger transposable element-derived protein 4 n=1 Tax=Aplysia californica TaxID=6500 RepID=A0ABM1VTR4_APLCA|nr:tigger transposable element-derived protein 4 [Aplysia californica]XP_035825806.1 tigger transposable element-derived protein 4 [Aplysia californica]
MAEQRKRKSFSVEEKRLILAEVDKKSVSKTQICKTFGISNSTLSTFIKNREKIENSSEPGRKRHKPTKFVPLEQAVFRWFQEAQALAVPVSYQILSTKAEEEARAMGINGFTANPGWLNRFKKRYNIMSKSVQGTRVKTLVMKQWIEMDFQELLQNFEAKDIYNADETGLFFGCLPSKTMKLKGETCTGGKFAKNRLTVLVAVNMDGSDKLPLLVIGKSQKPRCFKHCSHFPLKYLANSKSWMTGEIFESWVRQLDNRFGRENRKVALFMDDCPAHPDIDNLSAITLVRLPPNTTAVLQPCGQGIIASLKQHYRKIVLQKLIARLDEGKDVGLFDQNILEAMYDLKTAWNNVSAATVVNCFQFAGFQSIESSEQASHLPSCSSNQCREYDLFGRFAQDILPQDVTFQQYLSVDEAVHTCEELTSQEVASDNNRQEEESEDEESPVPLPPPSTSDARNAVATLRRYLQTQDWETVDEYLDSVGNIASSVDFHAITKGKQTSIRDFFKVRF